MLYFIRRLIHIFVSPTEDTEFLGFDSIIPKRIIDVGDGSLLLYMTIAVNIAAQIIVSKPTIKLQLLSHYSYKK